MNMHTALGLIRQIEEDAAVRPTLGLYPWTRSSDGWAVAIHLPDAPAGAYVIGDGWRWLTGAEGFVRTAATVEGLLEDVALATGGARAAPTAPDEPCARPTLAHCAACGKAVNCNVDSVLCPHPSAKDAEDRAANVTLAMYRTRNRLGRLPESLGRCTSCGGRLPVDGAFWPMPIGHACEPGWRAVPESQFRARRDCKMCGGMGSVAGSDGEGDTCDCTETYPETLAEECPF